MLTRVTTALSLKTTDRVVNEVYRQNVELGRAKWIEGGSPMPHRGGGKAPNWRYIRHAFWTPSFLIYF
jgi:hypothetical protein